VSKAFVPYRLPYSTISERAIKTAGIDKITAGYTTLYSFINSLSAGTVIHANSWNPPSNLTDLPAKPSSKSVGVALDIVKGENSSLYYDTVVLRYSEKDTNILYEYHGHMNGGETGISWSQLSFVTS